MKILSTLLYLTGNNHLTLSTLNRRLYNLADRQEELFKSITVGLILALSILFIKPFGIRYSNGDYLIQLLVLTYSTITMILVFFNEKFASKLFNNIFSFKSDYRLISAVWNTFLSVSIFFVCLLVFSISFEVNRLFITIGLKLTFFFLFPILFFVSNFVQNSKENNNRILYLKSMNKKEFFSVRERNLYFVKCEDNYAAIHYLNHNTNMLEKRLIRLSLTKLNMQLSPNSFQRCHRSFIVNVKQIKAINGSKKKQKIFLKNSSHIIPISRKYSLKFSNLKNKFNQ